MKQGFYQEHWRDQNGNPAGGVTSGRGITISWQNGPLGQINGVDHLTRKEPNGAFVEDVIQAAIERLEFFQTSPFACEENVVAIRMLMAANDILSARTRRREQAGVEGTHQL